MSHENACLAIRLEGPLQSWGYDSQFDYRKTGLMPTKSGIAGLCCAAAGISRGSDREDSFLRQFRAVKMLAVSIPRKLPIESNDTLEVRRLRDYHTVQGTRKASGGIKQSHLTYRYYLQDAAFVVILVGSRTFLRGVAESLCDPEWGVWLGRKCCVPSAPVFAGFFQTENEALEKLLNGNSLDKYVFQREVSNFRQGDDTLPDQPICFGSPKKEREFAPRRVISVKLSAGE